MYQVYGPPQPYFAAAYTPYHQVSVSSRPGTWRPVARPRFLEHRLYPEVRGTSARVRGVLPAAEAPGMRGLPALPQVGRANPFSLSTRSLEKVAKPC